MGIFRDIQTHLIMKAMLAVAVLACVAALALADGYGYKPGFRRVYNGIAAPYNNAERQWAVNKKAEYVGASSGTARWYGVPGTGRHFGYGSHGYDSHHGHNYGRHHGGYDNDRYYNDGY